MIFIVNMSFGWATKYSTKCFSCGVKFSIFCILSSNNFLSPSAEMGKYYWSVSILKPYISKNNRYRLVRKTFSKKQFISLRLKIFSNLYVSSLILQSAYYKKRKRVFLLRLSNNTKYYRAQKIRQKNHLSIQIIFSCR